MNNNQDVGVLFCPKCGNELSIHNAVFCTKCGSEVSAQNVLSTDLEKQQKKSANKSKTALAFLILSIFNLFVGVPLAVYFLVLWLLLGALSGDANTYYGILLFGCGYVSASIVSVVTFIINLIAKGKYLLVSFIMIFIGFIFGIIAPVIFFNSDFSPSRDKMVQNTLSDDEVVFEDDDLKIKQLQINYDKFDVKLYFTVETQNKDNYSLPAYLTVRVNSCQMNAMITKSVDDLTGNLYYLSISYNDLNSYDITDISTIEFDIYNKKDRNDINVVFEIDSNTSDGNISNIEVYDLIYSDEYFKLYFDPHYSSDRANLYIQSLVYDDYYLTFNNPDFDTPGYLNDYITNVELNNYSVTNSTFYFHPCDENMSYVKFEYVIKNKQNEVVKQENVEFNYSSAKIKSVYCQK